MTPNPEDRGAEIVFVEFLADLERGGSKGIDDLCARHPELAEDLRGMWAHEKALRSKIEWAFPGGEEAGGGPEGAKPREMVPLSTGSMLSFYEILGPLGAGGMGQVFRARDTRLEREVAIKVLPVQFVEHEARLQRFDREAKVLASLNHPNVGQIYGLDQIGDTYFLALELVAGEDLAERLSRGPLPVAETLKICKQVAMGLEAAHAAGIVHRDLKPANIMVDAKGTAKVLDFGLAMASREEEPEPGRGFAVRETGGDWDPEVSMARLTEAGLVMGTVPYMSPEQTRGEPMDKRSDIWSFGCLLFELLTGERPFQRAVATLTLNAIVSQQPEWERLPPDTPPALLALLRQCLQKDADVRLHDIADARIAIDELSQSGSTIFPVPIRERRTLLTLAGSMAVALAVLLVALFTNVGGVRDKVLARFGRMPPTEIESVVALPCTVVSTEEEGSGLFVDPVEEASRVFLADAIPSTLSVQLGRAEGLETRKPPSSAQFASIDGDLDKVADIYGVGAMIRSEVTVEGDELAIRIDLLAARSLARLWKGEFSGSRGEYLEMIREAADGLRAVMRPDAPSVRDPAPGLSESSEAELAFRQGKYFSSYFRAYNQEQQDFDRAMAAFGRALEADPGLAEAAAEVAMLHAYKFQPDLATLQWKEIEEWALRARGIDESCGLAWAVLPALEIWYRLEGDEGKRFEDLLRAAKLSTDHPIPHFALGQALSDFSLSLATEGYREASRLDPLYLTARTNLIGSLQTVGRLTQALTALEEAEHIESNKPWLLMNKGSILAMLGNTVRAGPIVDQLESLAESGAFHPDTLLELQLEFALANPNRVAAEDLVARIEEKIASPETRPDIVKNLVFSATSALADHGWIDAAFGILDRGAARGLLLPFDYLALNQRLETLRADPRYSAAIAPARERFVQMVVMLEEARARGEIPPYLESSLDELLMQLGFR